MPSADYTDLCYFPVKPRYQRELEGMAISDNPNLKPIITSPSQDILHAWPGTLIPLLKWIQVDPTWGVLPFDYFNKLDFNHQFVIHGQDPEYPYSR